MKTTLFKLAALALLTAGMFSCAEQMSLQDGMLADSEWKITNDMFLGLDEAASDYSLAKPNPENMADEWGVFVRFSSDGTFYSYNRESCGNSCYTKVYGRYSLPENDVLSICVDSARIDCTMELSGKNNEFRTGSGIAITFKVSNYGANGFQLQQLSGGSWICGTQD